MRKERPLSEDQWELMRRLSEIGERICRPLTTSRYDELERDPAGIALAISLPTVARLDPEPAVGA